MAGGECIISSDFSFTTTPSICSLDEIKWIGKTNSRKLILFSILLFASICFIDSVSAQDGKNAVRSLTEKGSSPGIIESKMDNESIYRNLLNSTWSQYNEDLNYSDIILAEYVKKNITAREAMIATVSLYTLTSKTEDEFYKAKPINKYKNTHNNTIVALSNLDGYLWNMTKFYETNKTIYAAKARESFNSSLYYYGKITEKQEELSRESNHEVTE
jgi:hypothetical protein